VKTLTSETITIDAPDDDRYDVPVYTRSRLVEVGVYEIPDDIEEWVEQEFVEYDMCPACRGFHQRDTYITGLQFEENGRKYDLELCEEHPNPPTLFFIAW
jgi:hypothetical protein